MSQNVHFIYVHFIECKLYCNKTVKKNIKNEYVSQETEMDNDQLWLSSLSHSGDK